MFIRNLSKIILVILAVGLLVTALVLLQPGWLIAIIARQSPEVIYSVEIKEPVVALTIDDGPDSITTPKILDLLEQHQARATFFLITNHISGNEAIVTQIVQNGHEIGNHLTADEPSITLPAAEFERKLAEAHHSLGRFAEVRWFRPGSGWYNGDMLSTAQKYGYKTVLGSVYPYDPWIPSAWFATFQIQANVESGSIIILHDNGSRGERTLVALTAILPALTRRGFRVVTLSDLADLSTPQPVEIRRLTGTQRKEK